MQEKISGSCIEQEFAKQHITLNRISLLQRLRVLSYKMDQLTRDIDNLRLSISRRERRHSYTDTDNHSSTLQTLPGPSASRVAPRWTPRPEGTISTSRAASEPTDEAIAVPAEPEPLQEHSCTLSTCSVQKLFAMPELLAIILSHIDTSNVMTLRRVNSTWLRTVSQSPQLRLHAFLRPQWARPASYFTLLDLKLPGLTIAKGDPVDRGHWIHVTMDAAAARLILPGGRASGRPRARSIYEGMRGGLGSRRPQGSDQWPAPESRQSVAPAYEDLQICQPPLVGIQAFGGDATVKIRGAGEASNANNDRREGPTQPSKLAEIVARAATILPHAAHQHTEQSKDQLDQQDKRGDQDDGVQSGLNAPNASAFAKLSCDAGITLGFLAETALEFLGSPVRSEGTAITFKAIVSYCAPGKVARRRGTARSVIHIG